jgi:hypothetical protein
MFVRPMDALNCHGKIIHAISDSFPVLILTGPLRWASLPDPDQRKRLSSQFSKAYQQRDRKVLLKMDEPDSIDVDAYRALFDLYKAGSEPAGRPHQGQNRAGLGASQRLPCKKCVQRWWRQT